MIQDLEVPVGVQDVMVKASQHVSHLIFGFINTAFMH